jgi:hypothetical protein
MEGRYRRRKGHPPGGRLVPGVNVLGNRCVCRVRALISRAPSLRRFRPKLRCTPSHACQDQDERARAQELGDARARDAVDAHDEWRCAYGQDGRHEGRRRDRGQDAR